MDQRTHDHHIPHVLHTNTLLKMRSPILLFLAAFLALASFASAWNKEDHEIFDLVSALEAAEGKGINFYSFVGVEPGATVEVINKAYRKKSMVLQ